MYHIKAFFTDPQASRLAGLLATEGSHGITESQDEVETSGCNDKNQKVDYKQLQKAFTPNALSHTMLGGGNIQTLSLKTLNTVQN